MSLSTKLDRVSNSAAISFFIYLFLSTKHCLNHVPNVRYQLIARIINLLLVLCWNYNLIVLVEDCPIFCFLLIAETRFPF